MSQIEREVQPTLEPMILGEKTTTVLSPNDQFVLSQWAYKTTLVLDLVLPGRRNVPDNWFSQFFRELHPPERGVMIWTTAYGGSETLVHSFRGELAIGFAPHYSRPYDKTLEAYKTDAFLITLTAFRAVFQVLGYSGGKWHPARDGGVQTEQFLIRLWPPTKTSVAWPKNGFALSDSALWDFSLRTDFF